jgi:hypothetical protein
MLVNGLRLPLELVEAIESGKWQPPADDSLYAEIFGDEPDLPSFYNLAAIDRENRSWRSVSPSDFLFQVTQESLGLSVELSLVVADLGPDRPIVLDYRLSVDRPRVVYLGGAGVPRWSEIAPTVGRLLELLKLA